MPDIQVTLIPVFETCFQDGFGANTHFGSHPSGWHYGWTSAHPSTNTNVTGALTGSVSTTDNPFHGYGNISGLGNLGDYNYPYINTFWVSVRASMDAPSPYTVFYANAVLSVSGSCTPTQTLVTTYTYRNIYTQAILYEYTRTDVKQLELGCWIGSSTAANWRDFLPYITLPNVYQFPSPTPAANLFTLTLHYEPVITSYEETTTFDQAAFDASGAGGMLAAETRVTTYSVVTITVTDVTLTAVLVPGEDGYPEADLPVGNCSNVTITSNATPIPTDGQHNGLKPAHMDGKLYYWYCDWELVSPGTTAHWEYERVYANVQSTMITTANGFFAERFGADSWTERIELNSLVYSANGMYESGWSQWLFYWNAFNQLQGYLTQTGNVALPIGFDTTNAHVYAIRMISAFNTYKEDVYDASYTMEVFEDGANHTSRITYPAADLIIGPQDPYMGTINTSGSLNEPGHSIVSRVYDPVTTNEVGSLVGTLGFGVWYYANGASFSGQFAAANIESLVFSRTMLAQHARQLKKSGETELPEWTPSSWYEGTSPWFELRIQRWIGETPSEWRHVYTNVVRAFNGIDDQVVWEIPNLLGAEGTGDRFVNNAIHPFFIDWSYDEESCFLLVSYADENQDGTSRVVWRVNWDNPALIERVGWPFDWHESSIGYHQIKPECIHVVNGNVYVGGEDYANTGSVIVSLPTSTNVSDEWGLSYSNSSLNCVTSFTGTFDSSTAWAGDPPHILKKTALTNWSPVRTANTMPTNYVGIWGQDNRALFAETSNSIDVFRYTDNEGATWQYLSSTGNTSGQYRFVGGIEWDANLSETWVVFQMGALDFTPEKMIMGALRITPCLSNVVFVTDVNTIDPTKTMDWGGPWIGIVDGSAFPIPRGIVDAAGIVATKYFYTPDPDLGPVITTVANSVPYVDPTWTGTVAREPGENIGTYAVYQSSVVIDAPYIMRYWTDGALSIVPGHYDLYPSGFTNNEGWIVHTGTFLETLQLGTDLGGGAEWRSNNSIENLRMVCQFDGLSIHLNSNAIPTTIGNLPEGFRILTCRMEWGYPGRDSFGSGDWQILMNEYMGWGNTAGIPVSLDPAPALTRYINWPTTMPTMDTLITQEIAYRGFRYGGTGTMVIRETSVGSFKITGSWDNGA